MSPWRSDSVDDGRAGAPRRSRTCPTAGSRPRSSSRSRCGRPLLLEGEAGVGKTEVGEDARAHPRRRADPAAVLRGDRRRRRRSTSGTTRASCSTRARSRPASSTRTSGSQELYGPEFLLERPLLRAIRAGRERRAADRRARPRRRRVRGVPARGALRLRGDGPRARHDRRRRSRRRSSSRRTGRASCTTRSSGAASTTGSTSPTSSARSRSSGSARPGSRRQLARSVAEAVARLRELDLVKPPGAAEAIDWAAGALAARRRAGERRRRRARRSAGR